MDIIYLILTLISILWLFTLRKRKKNLASLPGPKGIPLFGNIFQLKKEKTYLQMTEWAKQYGPVYALNLAGQPMLVVSGREALYEVLVSKGEDFAGRPQSFRSSLYPGNFVLSDPSQIFKLEKKMLMRHFKGYGSGAVMIEKIVMEEMKCLIQELNKLCGDGRAIVQLDDLIEQSILNISWVLSFGYIADKTTARQALECVRGHFETMDIGLMGQILDAFPWTQYLGHPYVKLIGKVNGMIANLYNNIKEKTYQDRASGKNMSTNLFHLMMEVCDRDNNIDLTTDHLKMLVVTILAATLPSTTGTLKMLLATLIQYPSVQESLQRECDEYLHGENVSITDRKNMPYHQATLLEITRLLPTAPLLVPHKAVRDSQITGFHVPKGTVVFPNIWALHHNENLWDDPYTFNPSRYLDEDGNLVPSDHPARVNNLAFSAGPRVCAGEPMANARMFLILATLVQNFEILPATTIGEQPPCGCFDVVDSGFTITALPYSVKLKPRAMK